LPIVVVCFVVMLMIWSMAGTSGGGGQDQPSDTTGKSSSQPTQALFAPRACLTMMREPIARELEVALLNKSR